MWQTVINQNNTVGPTTHGLLSNFLETGHKQQRLVDQQVVNIGEVMMIVCVMSVVWRADGGGDGTRFRSCGIKTTSRNSVFIYVLSGVTVASAQVL